MIISLVYTSGSWKRCLALSWKELGMQFTQALGKNWKGAQCCVNVHSCTCAHPDRALWMSQLLSWGLHYALFSRLCFLDGCWAFSVIFLLPSHLVVWLRFPLLPLSSQQAQILWFCSSLTRWTKSCSGAALSILNGYCCPAMPEISLCMSCPVHKGKFVHGKPPSCWYQS